MHQGKLVFARLMALLPLSTFDVELGAAVYAFDASTIDLRLSVFGWVPFSSIKAGIKLHTLMHLRGNIPSFIRITGGKTHEVNTLDDLALEVGAYYLLDRGYLDFARLFVIHQVKAFFVTRTKSNTQFMRRYSHPVDWINTAVRTSENAVKTQIRIAVSTYLMIAIGKKRLHLEHHSLDEILQILSLSMFEANPINQLLTPPSANSDNGCEPDQLALV